MKPLTYFCSNKHCPRRWKNFTSSRQPGYVRCRECKLLATRLSRIPHGTTVNFIQDIPPHFNSAFGREVHSRRHLKELQDATGAQDFEPDSETRERIKMAHEKARR